MQKMRYFNLLQHVVTLVSYQYLVSVFPLHWLGVSLAICDGQLSSQQLTNDTYQVSDSRNIHDLTMYLKNKKGVRN